jgi:type IV pilus assembly protein PilA
MENGKSVARLRLVRELLGRTGREDEGEEREEGFTLIELMVVLLIMGILLAIAIPTFLSVVGGAKKTAAQSNLTNAVTSAQGIYSLDGAFPATAAATITQLAKTQKSLKFTQTAVKGLSTVSVAQTGTNYLIMAVKANTGTVCWVAVMNEGTTTKKLPTGDSFNAVKKAAATCKGSAFITAKATTPPNWKSDIATVQAP